MELGFTDNDSRCATISARYIERLSLIHACHSSRYLDIMCSTGLQLHSRADVVGKHEPHSLPALVQPVPEVAGAKGLDADRIP